MVFHCQIIYNTVPNMRVGKSALNTFFVSIKVSSYLKLVRYDASFRNLLSSTYTLVMDSFSNPYKY